MYTSTNFKSKKEFKEALKAGKKITIFAPGLGQPKTDGTEFISGPQYPQPHTCYAEVTMKDGYVTSIK